MKSGSLVAEDMREDALVDLDAILVALEQVGLGGDLPARRRKPGNASAAAKTSSSRRTKRDSLG